MILETIQSEGMSSSSSGSSSGVGGARGLDEQSFSREENYSKLSSSTNGGIHKKQTFELK